MHRRKKSAATMVAVRPIPRSTLIRSSIGLQAAPSSGISDHRELLGNGPWGRRRHAEGASTSTYSHRLSQLSHLPFRARGKKLLPCRLRQMPPTVRFWRATPWTGEGEGDLTGLKKWQSSATDRLTPTNASHAARKV